MIPEGSKGIWSIRYDGCCCLLKDGRNYMDASYFEYIGNISQLTGKVLCCGLGLGLIVEHLVKQSNIEKVTCVEISQDLIDLVWEHLEKNNKAEIICMEINDYIALGTLSYFDSVFIDIWFPYDSEAKATMQTMRTQLEEFFPTDKIILWEEQKFLEEVL